MTSPRRTFLKHAGIGAAAFAALPSSSRALSADPLTLQEESTAAMQEAEAYFASLEEQPPAEPWDTSWTKRVVGTHKAMFDVPEVEGGAGVMRSAIWQRQYNDVLKPQAGEMTSVVVIRHSAIPLAMNQEFWTTYEVGKEFKIKGEKDKPMKFNPVLLQPGAEAGSGMSAYMLDSQIAKGTIVLGCNLAYRSIISHIQQKDKSTPAEAKKKADSMLVPGVIMQPSGIFANVMAQQAGCVFVQAV
ncbi:MAG: twin-arginine translocation signal domain-containing protein [Gemmatimonadaceae bacterium]|nr:twin-arginine translocation signal domain-containing protein [Gemmatimonadaceae bacterium]